MARFDEKYDVLIVGSGLAGLGCALKLPKQLKIGVFAKAHLSQTNTNWAQGGIAAVQSTDDTFESHIHDTLIAGADLCDVNVVKHVIKSAPDRLQDLINWGVSFDTNLTVEGGHSHRRISHVEDATGRAIQNSLLARCRERQNINLVQDVMLVDLIVNKHLDPKLVTQTQVIGAYVLDKTNGTMHVVSARFIVLATGGLGKIYLYTSNWEGATGDGIAAAFRAGARVANLEFTQFHPTALYHHKSRNFLISEALRGEGGTLINSKGEAFMHKYHPAKSLAPRDIVARSIDAEMKSSGSSCVFLDMTHLERTFLEKRFPKIFHHCLELGIDISKDPIPVVPAAHYSCGGVVTNIAGQTDISRLFVLGESAHTGLHGANRLASNSLLECLVMAHECAAQITNQMNDRDAIESINLKWIYPPHSDQDELVVIHHMWDEIRTLMWNYVGIVRTNKRMQRALERLELINREVSKYYREFQPNSDIVELRNLALVALLTVKCAIKRKESRGIHYNLDYPNSSNEERKDTIIWQGDYFS